MNSGLVSKALWTAEDAVAATGGRLVGADTWIATGVSIDSRTLEPGDLFVALTDARDGHDFVPDAFAKGAAAALVSRIDAGSGPMLAVAETPLLALGRLAVAARARSPSKRAAITGSVGKTSLKEALAACLSAQGPTHHAVKSFNNHIGVPLTLARMAEDSAFAVFEIGMNHRGEIAPLVDLVRPHVALITWVAPAHIENLGSLEAIADEKADIFTGLVAGGGAVIPADAPHADRLLEVARAHAGHVVRVGRGAECEARLLGVTPQGEGAILAADVMGVRVSGFVAGLGPHVAHTAMLALAGAALLGADVPAALAALASHMPVAGRGKPSRVAASFGDFTLVDDAYNANPASVAVAIETLALRHPGPGGRRIAALGDMLELGADEAAYHAGLAEPIAQHGVDLVFCAGPRMAHLWEALPSDRRGGYADNSDALIPMLTSALRAGDVVLVKGSNGSRMGRVVEALSALSAQTGNA